MNGTELEITSATDVTGLQQSPCAPQDEDEATLVSKCRNGDLDAFDQLMELHQNRIYHLAFRMTGNSDDASDITQETFIRAFNSLPRFRGECAFKTWLYRIACNICLDVIKHQSHHRRRTVASSVNMESREEFDLLEHTPEPSPGPDELVQQRERQRLIQKAIAALPEHQRTVLVLYDIQNETYESIAQILHISIGTVKSRLNRARLSLKNRLASLREQL